MSDPVVIYTTTVCPYCIRAKHLLAKKAISYREIDVSSDAETRKFLVEASGQRTVPQIFIGGQSIGGCDELYALDRAGKLDAMVQRALNLHAGSA